jgi:hypothetical protein
VETATATGVWTRDTWVAPGSSAGITLLMTKPATATLDVGLIPIAVLELLRLVRDTVIPPPRRGQPHRLHWSAWRRRHQHRARQAHQRWNAYAETTP